MTAMNRRGVLKGSLGLAAASTLATPALAKGTTIKIWWNQGFYPAEDAAFRALIKNWEKASGNKVNLTMLPTQAMNEKIISALTSGSVPDIMYADNAPAQIVPQNAWKGRLVDVSDIVEEHKSVLSETALVSSKFYNAKEKKRSYYGVPYKGASLNMPAWKSLIEKAGYKVSDIPDTWNEFFAFFEPVQKALRKKGMRHTYGLGYTMSTVGDDPNNLFNQFLVAHGGYGIVTPDGQLHTHDPKVRQAFIDTLNQVVGAFKAGYVPPSALNWGDPDNNNAFHAKEVVMSPNDTISISVAVKHNKKWYYDDIIGLQMPKSNQGKTVPALLGVELAFIPKGAQHVDAAKDFLRYLMNPSHLANYLQQAEGRWLPVMPSIVHKHADYWLDKKDPHRYPAVEQGVIKPTLTWPYVYNPAYAQVDAEHVFSVAESDMINGMSADKAVDKAFAHMEKIFSRYQIPHGA